MKNGSELPYVVSLDIPKEELKNLFAEIAEKLDELKERKQFLHCALPHCALWRKDQRVFIAGDYFNGEFQ